MSSHSNLSKFEKEKQKLIQEKCQTILNDMLRDEDNKYCVDCDAKGPRWASWNLGLFLCIRCAGIHRNLGVHISRVKSVNLDTWTPEQVVTMQNMGNSRARALYEANMPDTLRRPQTDSSLESFIRAKYEHKKYIAKEWVQPSPVKVNWDAEVEESMRKSKEAKKTAPSTADIGRIPSPVPKPQAASVPTAKTPVIDVRKIVASAVPTSTSNGHSAPVTTSASEDLLGLMGDSSSFTSTNTESKNTVSTTDELGNIFLSPTSTSSSSADLGKMSKESILSLYGSTPANFGANPFIQGGGGGGSSSFGNSNLQSLTGQTPTFSTAGGYNYMNPNLTNNFPAQMSEHSIPQQPSNVFQGFNQMGTSSPGYGGQPQNDLMQVQNQLIGLNFGVPKGTGSSAGPPSVHSTFNKMPTTNPSTQMNSQLHMNSMYPPPSTGRSDNLRGLGNSVSQLMQPNMSGVNFWK